MQNITNGILDVTVNENGSLLDSVKYRGEEYLWQGSEKSWKSKDIVIFPFVARLVESSLRELDGNIIEAAQSMGATPFQIITKVMIPECLPGLISSMTTALTTILGYSAMSGVIGGGGLGKIALSYGYYRYQTNIMIVCVVLLVLMVQAFQSVGTLWATKSDKRLRK